MWLIPQTYLSNKFQNYKIHVEYMFFVRLFVTFYVHIWLSCLEKG